MKITQKLNPLAELKYYFTPVFFISFLSINSFSHSLMVWFIEYCPETKEPERGY